MTSKGITEVTHHRVNEANLRMATYIKTCHKYLRPEWPLIFVWEVWLDCCNCTFRIQNFYFKACRGEHVALLWALRIVWLDRLWNEFFQLILVTFDPMFLVESIVTRPLLPTYGRAPGKGIDRYHFVCLWFELVTSRIRRTTPVKELLRLYCIWLSCKKDLQ